MEHNRIVVLLLARALHQTEMDWSLNAEMSIYLKRQLIVIVASLEQKPEIYWSDF